MSRTVIVRTEGCVHTYNCESEASARLLFTAMCVYIDGSVELWHGSDRIARN